jgi:hypothetical protein
MKGFLYIVDFGKFRKIGSTIDFSDRLKGLRSQYSLEPVNCWVSPKIENYQSAELFALDSVKSSIIHGEKTWSDFDECVGIALSSVKRANSIIKSKVFADGLVMVDPVTGYINANNLIKKSNNSRSLPQFLRNKSVLDMKESLLDTYGVTTHFTIKGSSGCTYMHPFIFIDFIRTFGAKEKRLVLEWFLNEMNKIDAINTLLSRSNREALK